jgi:hypothetical protein
MTKKHTSHLCTFMGREANLKILLPYIETALQIEAVDNYWFIDMTRKRSDHELIKAESERLNKLFPGRVHLYNSEERAKIIDNAAKIEQTIGQWDTFYKFLSQFTDNDIIAKCDDDTYFIDVETLKAAFDLRWVNKKPYLMHANAINNGLTAYHQKQLNDVYPDEESKMYPIGGLTGPLFAHPEIACAHHKQFTADMLKDRKNIEKYKISNIYFNNRVSINFIFMLGSDRHALSKITRQDEYDTSSKYPQREDRPNMIIGGFLMAHHTYGVQEPVMERLQTHIGYEELSNKINNPNIKHSHKDINLKMNPFSTIKKGSLHLFKSWINKKTHVIKNPKTGLYLAINTKDDDTTRQLFLKSHTDWTDDFQKACLFDISLDGKEPILFSNSNMLMKAPIQLKGDKWENIEGNRCLTFPVQFYFKGQYRHSNMLIKQQPSGNYLISPTSNPDFNLVPNDDPHPNFSKQHPDKAEAMKKLIFLDKNKQHEWEVINIQTKDLTAADIVRPDDFYAYANDETYAVSTDSLLPDLAPPKEWIWMVKGYIWEFINTTGNAYKIKLIADDEEDKYLRYHPVKKINLSSGADLWEVKDQTIRHFSSKKYIDITSDGVAPSDNAVKLSFDI